MLTHLVVPDGTQVLPHLIASGCLEVLPHRPAKSWGLVGQLGVLDFNKAAHHEGLPVELHGS